MYYLTPLGSANETRPLSSLTIDLDRTELALTSSVAILAQTVLLLCGGVLLCRNDTSMLVKDKLGPRETTRGFVSGSVPNLGAGTFQHFVCFAVNVVLPVMAAIQSFHHFTKIAVIIND